LRFALPSKAKTLAYAQRILDRVLEKYGPAGGLWLAAGLRAMTKRISFALLSFMSTCMPKLVLTRVRHWITLNRRSASLRAGETTLWPVDVPDVPWRGLRLPQSDDLRPARQRDQIAVYRLDQHNRVVEWIVTGPDHQFSVDMADPYNAAGDFAQRIAQSASSSSE
jgi:hypothetical protein